MEIEFYLEKNHASRSVKVWCEEQRGCSERANITFDYKKNVFVSKHIEGCSIGDHKPLMEFPDDMFKELVKSIVVYNERNSIVTEKQDVVKGILIATDEHLKNEIKTKESLIDLLSKFITK